MNQQSITQAAARGASVTRAVMVKHYAAQIRVRRDLTKRQKVRAIRRYEESISGR